MVLWIPCLRAHATICRACAPAFTRAEANLTEQRDTGRRQLGEVGLRHALLDHRGTGQHLHASGTEVVECALRGDRQGLESDNVLRPSGRCTSPAEIIVVTPPLSVESIQPS